MITKTDSIKAFLNNFAPKDLADLYNHDMEVQVTVAKDNGERITGDFKGKQWHAYTDGIQTWKPIRIPINGNTNPEFTDSAMIYDLKDHAEGIGMTGWDWKNKVSRWVAFDFDAIIGHSDKHSKKLTDIQLEEIKKYVNDIPWITVRKSTGGKGLHLYVFLEPIQTNVRNEHAAIARAILSQLSALVGYDFNTKVDTQGGNLWIWHRKLIPTNGEGLKVLKNHTQLAKVPENWKDYLPVISGLRNKNLPRYIEEQKSIKGDVESLFEELTGQRLRVNLDEEHKKVFNWLVENYPNAVWWDSDHHMMVTHTILLKECHNNLCLRGVFETLATGEEKGTDINVFCYPLLKGGWSVRRYTLGVQEHPSWEQDGSGWTKTTFNREPDLHGACKLHDGIEEPKGGYWFANAESAQKAALLVGANLNLPNFILMKKTRLLPHKSGKLVVEIDKDNDTPPMGGWLSAKSKFVKMFSINNPTPGEPEVISFDSDIRHLITENGDDFGWVIKSENEWHQEPFQHIKEYIKSKGFNPKDVSNILGTAISQCWTLVNIPFREEYPSDRKWNRHAVQLRFKPKTDKENLNYPIWSKILDHCGLNLTEAVLVNGWCKANNIITGSDYLKCWIASLFQFPTEPLPYLFFYGPQNNGKSIFHEALSLLLVGGVCRADTALTNGSGFNGELEGSILAVIEETDLRKNLVAYNRIKDWVTSLKLPIHKKQRQPYLIPNLCHFIQSNNDYNSCPVLMGDSRITMINVPELRAEELIPKKQLIPLLEHEASDFITEILNIELPASNDRLNIPVLLTEDKRIAELANQSMLGIFIEEKCFYAPGYKILFSEFYEKYLEWLDPNFHHQWSKVRVGKELLNFPKFPKGRGTSDGGQFSIGNISFVEIKTSDFRPKFITLAGFLKTDKSTSFLNIY